jgi:hypothetical protein
LLTEQWSSETARRIIEALGNHVATAITRKDIALLESFTHPDKGVMFAAYAGIGSDNVVLKHLTTAYESDRTLVWGYSDGTGDPINLSFREFFDRYIYWDLRTAKEVGFNRVIGRGNNCDNALQYFPNSITVEYHDPGTNGQLLKIGWRSSRLVFQEKKGTWYLVAVVNDQWTI